MPDKRADLHLHTRFSDGTETPERVVELAKAAGLDALAITDHDNTDALPIAASAAQRHGLELIPGIEMSAAAEELEVHLLGFFFDPKEPAFMRHLAEQQARRVARIHEMVRRLQQHGLNITAEEVFALSGAGTVGRPHVARALLNRGYISSMAEAFDRYIGGPRHPGYVPGSTIAPAQIIRVIREAGGIPVLAHPIYLKRDDIIRRFVDEGLVGLEAYHSGHPPEAVLRYERLADELHLLKTGGSDFHGDAKEGVPVGAVKVPYELVEALKAWKTANVR